MIKIISKLPTFLLIKSFAVKSKSKTGKWAWVGFFLMVVALAGVNFFWRLGQEGLQEYDESRHGVSGLEMLQSGDWASVTYMGAADYCNLKPPALIWLIALSYKIWGQNLFALRFFSAFFAVMSVALAMLFAKKYWGRAAGIICGLTLATTKAFVVHINTGRHGATESILAFLVLLFAYLISKAEYDEDGKAGYFYLSGLVAGAVFLLKSFFVFLVLIILASFYVLKLNKNRITVKKAFAFAAMSAAPVLIWAAARLSRADGAFYFKRFFEIDLLGRLFTKTDMHGYNALYYVQHIAIEHAWLFFIAVLLGVLIKRAGLKNRALLKFIILTALIILFVLSVSKSQRFWYIYSLWPLLSIIAGALLSSLAARKRRGRYTWREFVCLLIFLVFFGLLCRKESDIISAIRNTHPIFAHKAMAIVKERGAAVYKINYERRDKILRGNVCPMSLIYDISQDGKYSNWAFSQSETFIVKVLKGGEPITVGSREDPILRRGGYVL